MTRFLLPLALLSIVCLSSQNAWAHHHLHVQPRSPRMQAATLGNNLPAGFGRGTNIYGNYGYGNGWYPGYVPMRYPGVGYVSEVVPGLPANVYTQSYFNSPAYGLWNGFGK
jgi:hypothetical protein